MSHVDKNNYQIACQRHFEITHPDAYQRGINTDGVGNHPNAWTAASMEYHTATATGSTGESLSTKGSGGGGNGGGMSSSVFVEPGTTATVELKAPA